MSGPEKNLLELGGYLKESGYRFVTPTPESHRRILGRVEGEESAGAPFRDVFGWSRPFRKHQLPPRLIRLLEDAGALEEKEGCFKSKVRASTLGDDLFFHSSYPTVEADSVFFGPDTYRFASLIRSELKQEPPRRAERIIDIGCGSGAGAIVALRSLLGRLPELVFTDVNRRALSYARVNAALAGAQKAEFFLSDLLNDVEGSADLIVANPPYLVDPEARLYRHGGGEFGGALSVRIASEAVKRLNPGGKLILYTGDAVVDGRSMLLQSLRDLPEFSKVPFRYEEIDPDVFGEELDKPHYKRVERIAAVSVTVSSPS